ncbi:acetate/propionate family kinase [Microlunatus sp. Y2014]|uniref:acetate/propionate family kinase n=1 Tax=Microlunatus sp. Y2014 TaxID=3418488 RepID=UPI003DA76593
MGTVLVVNSGSSSIKYELLDPASGQVHATGLVERIGEPASHLRHTHDGKTVELDDPVADHGAGLRRAIDLFGEHGPALSDAGVVGVGHRVVQGGERIVEATLIDDAVLATIEALSPLAPLHNPANATGIRVARELFPDLPHVAVCDTAFFHDLPMPARTYAIDREVAAEHQIRRYGFHGTSHAYVADRSAVLLGRDDLKLIVLHLGNGCSVSAVVAGRPVETSMGLTPLEGLVMGTRTGDIDPAVVFHLAREAGLGIDEIDNLLNRRSGLKGLSGHNDMREVTRLAGSGDENARLALDVYTHRIRKYVGAYAATMGGLDAVAFTAGVGENSALVREESLTGLGFLGIDLDPVANRADASGERIISRADSPATVLVVPTNEELSIARQTRRVAESTRQPNLSS